MINWDCSVFTVNGIMQQCAAISWCVGTQTLAFLLSRFGKQISCQPRLSQSRNWSMVHDLVYGRGNQSGGLP